MPSMDESDTNKKQSVKDSSSLAQLLSEDPYLTPYKGTILYRFVNAFDINDHK